jgi:hypothetical protein
MITTALAAGVLDEAADARKRRVASTPCANQIFEVCTR